MQPYDNYVNEMLQLLKERGVCSWSRTSHRVCYEEFRVFLAKNDRKYSEEAAQIWLEEVINLNKNHQEYHAKRNYILQLAELVNTGTVINDHLLLTKSFYDKLPEQLRTELDVYLDSCRERYSKRSFELAKIHCAHFLLFLSEQGVESLAQLDYSVLHYAYEADRYLTADGRYVILSHARQMLCFYTDKRICSRGFLMLLVDDIYPYANVFEKIEPADQIKIEELSKNHFICTADRMYDAIAPFVSAYQRNNYSYTMKHTTDHTLRALYVFLDMNGLNYHPKISYIWFKVISPITGKSFRAWRRVLKLFEYHMTGLELSFDRKCSLVPGRMEEYPEWCKNEVISYLKWLKKSFHNDSTIRSYKYSVWDFCDYLLSMDLNNFTSLTPEAVKKYISQDKHATFKGRAGRIMILRQFIEYLEDHGLISNKNLHLTLSVGIADTVKIPDIISDTDIGKIYKYRESSSSSIELRNSAMVLLGLRLGLRASDVVNLKFSDIDWKEKIVSIIQIKTKAEITLPLANDVGNAIYRYIQDGRPAHDSEYVFIRHKAPYGKVTTKVCTKALNAILPERDDHPMSGFHVLRRTFATRILRRNTGIESVIDSLGHHDNTTVMKYLSFDEERMRKCPLLLDECSITLNGGAL